MANYPNLNISKENFEAMKKVAKLLNMRSASAVHNKLWDIIRMLMGTKKEGE